jgi:hypothetical protein
MQIMKVNLIYLGLNYLYTNSATQTKADIGLVIINLQ